MSQDQDTNDVRKVRAGDTEAFAGIVSRWQGPLVTLAYRFCRNREQALDMAQMAFLKIFRGLSQWRGEASFSSWMFAVATNVYRSETRKHRVHEIPLENLDRFFPAPSTRKDRRDELDREAAVRHAVATLPEKYRDVLTLFYFHDQEVSQTADTLGLAEGTVKARLHRGRNLLRKKLGNLLGPTGSGEES